MNELNFLPEILAADTPFLNDFSEPGDDECTCSRCGKAIKDACVRVEFSKETYSTNISIVAEYRYHAECVGMQNWFEKSDRA